jgi:3-oxoadipate CoA-transferase beta subunit
LTRGWSKFEQAERIASRLAPGSYVNLGIGMPGIVASAVRPEDGIVFHCENGLIGYRQLTDDDEEDPDVIDAGSQPVAMIEGAAVVPHEVSFMIARGPHLDATVLGAYQVSMDGDLANWKTPTSDLAGVGGAMDLATGARNVIVMMRHQDREGNAKILRECTYPLTARRCVTLIVTELAVIAVTDHGLVVEEHAASITPEQLQELTDAPLDFRPTDPADNSTALPRQNAGRA